MYILLRIRLHVCVLLQSLLLRVLVVKITAMKTMMLIVMVITSSGLSIE